MWARRVNCIGEGFQRGFDDIQFAEHGRREQIETRAVLKQGIGDVFSAHMSRAAQGGFKIPTTPIPAGINQPGLLSK